MNIGLLGFGVVGGGVWELAQENRALNVKKVLVRREAPPLGKAAVQDVEAILRDTDIDTVVEVLGGLHPAYEWICRALAAGKDVVTANKAVISAYYRELTALAHENGAALRCTAPSSTADWRTACKPISPRSFSGEQARQGRWQVGAWRCPPTRFAFPPPPSPPLGPICS